MDKKQTKLVRLRERAEAVLDQMPTHPQYIPQNPGTLMQELQVYQLELELQLEDLQKSYDALANAQQRSTKFFDLAPVGYLVMDTSGKILKANLAASRLLGIEREALEGSVFSDYVAEGFQDSFYLCQKALLHQRQAQGCELQLEKQDGSQLPVLINADLTDTESSEICIAITDISSLKESDEVIAQTLAHEKELDPLRMTVLALIEPEFRVPLVHILRSLQLLYQYENRLTAKKREALYQSGRNLVWYLMDALQDARSIQASQHSERRQLESFDLLDFSQQIVNDMKVIVPEGQKIVLDAVSRDDSSSLRWYPNVFRRILMNLLIHALKASREVVQCQLQIKPSSIHLQVDYQASPISEAQLQQSFDALDKGIGAEFIHGRGNSLALAFDAVQAYGGAIHTVSHAEGTKSIHLQLPH